MTIRPDMGSSRRAVNLFIFHFTMALYNFGFEPSSCLSNVTKITRKTMNKIDTTPVLSRDLIF